MEMEMDTQTEKTIKTFSIYYILHSLWHLQNDLYVAASVMRQEYLSSVLNIQAETNIFLNIFLKFIFIIMVTLILKYVTVFAFLEVK
jgi:hypothetical protein